MLNNEFHFIRENLINIDKENLKVSKVNVGWHLDHSLKVINGVFKVLKNSNSSEYKKEFNKLRFVVFLIGRFPRGRAKSPKRVFPPEIVVKEDVESQLNLAIENVKLISSIKENQYFTHPLFKQLNKKQTLKFLRLHTNHHLKIVKDILK